MLPLLYPLGLMAAGWSIRAYADHNVAVDEAEASASDDSEPEDEEQNAESVWASITNTEGLF